MEDGKVVAQRAIGQKKRFDQLCRNVFSTIEGKELFDLIYTDKVEGNLYQETDRATAYAIGQRDFVLEIKDRIKSTTTEQGIPGGEEVS